MHTMKESKRNPVIRVHPQTRTKLKILAAQHGQTMQDYLEWLMTYAMTYDLEIERQQKGVGDAISPITCRGNVCSH